MKVIAIMRPASYLAESVKLAHSMGFAVVTAPMIDVVDKTDANFFGFVVRIMKGEVDYVIFTSANGVEFTLLKLDDPEGFIEQLNKTHVVAIGPETKKALLKNKIRVSIVPESYSSQGLVEHVTGVEGAVIEIARSSHGAPELVEGLRKKGAIVHETQVYQIISPRDERHDALMKRALAGEVDIFAFTSSMMVRNFMALADEMGVKDELVGIMNEKSQIEALKQVAVKVKDELVGIMNEKTTAAIGKPTADTLSGYGVNVKVMPKRYTFEELLRECRERDC